MLNKEAYSQAYNVITLLSPDLINKIPKDVWKAIENRMDRSKVKRIKNVKEYTISLQAYQILAVLFRKYYATEEEKKIIRAKELIIRRKKFLDNGGI